MRDEEGKITHTYREIEIERAGDSRMQASERGWVIQPWSGPMARFASSMQVVELRGGLSEAPTAMGTWRRGYCWRSW